MVRPGRGVFTLVLASTATLWGGCSGDAAEEPHVAALGKQASKIWGDDARRDHNNGLDTFVQDTVVFVQLASGTCSGTLITPSLVLTAAHCLRGGNVAFIGIGPDKTSFRRQVTAPALTALMQSPYIDDSNADLAIVQLDQPVLDIALSRRPMAWNGWQSNGSFGDTSAGFGLAGYSRYSGPWSCPDLDPGPTDAEHVQWRQFAQTANETSFIKLQGDDTITWYTDNNNKTAKGDSGGPLYHITPSGGREVVGVASKEVCAWNLTLLREVRPDASGGIAAVSVFGVGVLAVGVVAVAERASG